MNPSSPEGFYLDASGMALPGLSPFSTLAPENSPATVINMASSPVEESNNKKVRKAYTISKSRESWSEPEHDKFFEALQLFDRDWKKIEAFVGSKTVIQIRSHAQKYFLKVQKSGTNERLPPPRPKRKAAHPYPLKALKNDISLSLATEHGLQRPDSMSMPTYPNNGDGVFSRIANSQAVSIPNATKGDIMRSTPHPVANNCSSSAESVAMARAAGEMNEPVNHGGPLRVLPDFAQVYSFIGSVFDPEASDHLHRLQNMDPIDVETVLLLMRNLSINLANPDFEDHRRLLACYDNDIDSEKAYSGAMSDICCSD